METRNNSRRSEAEFSLHGHRCRGCGPLRRQRHAVRAQEPELPVGGVGCDLKALFVHRAVVESTQKHEIVSPPSAQCTTWWASQRAGAAAGELALAVIAVVTGRGARRSAPCASCDRCLTGDQIGCLSGRCADALVHLARFRGNVGRATGRRTATGVAARTRGAATTGSREARVSAGTCTVTWKRSPGLPGSSPPASALSATKPSASARRCAIVASSPAAVAAAGTCSSAACTACSSTAPPSGVSVESLTSRSPSVADDALGARCATRRAVVGRANPPPAVSRGAAPTLHR